ncbi:DUF4932 domain-containing protein [Pedobacter sp. JY14-1]|uniref:DUF4932 domain-containing protein n=1 Tax=Pedobacter sp. JY14-1 TaxID=3034151 RepID=UPI0023E10507|nr:DUF4932 domain-containing protein [Pedobacter sp. JY14-1]
MRRKLPQLLLVLLLIVGPYSVFAHYSGIRKKFKACKIELNGVNFTVDPRIELFHTIEVISGIPLVNFIGLDYKEKIQANFAPFKDHPLFAFLKQNPVYGKLFKTIDAPIWFLIHLDNDLEWRKDVPYSEKENPKLDSLRLMMKDFAAKSGYAGFFNRNLDLYKISLESLTYNLPDFDEKNRLLDYCGVKDKSAVQFNVIVNFLGWGNFGPRIFKGNQAELYAIIAPEKMAIRVPTFDVAALYRLIWHEFAHSFANPAIERANARFEELNYLWPPVKESMKAQAYSSWESVVKEHLTEAIACRMAAKKFGEDAADLNFVRLQKAKDWIYLNPLIKALKYYESNRNTYPDLDSFIPKIFECLKAVKQHDIDLWLAEKEPLKKPDLSSIPEIGAIYSRKHILFILPTGEKDKDADLKLKDFISKFKNQVSALKDAKTVDDTTALKMDLSPYNLSVWGTPSGNRFLKEHLAELPVGIYDDKIIGENVYNGTGYGMLIGWVNPVNPENVMAVYTAQNPANLVDFNRIMNGSGNYHIFRNFVTIKYGDFKRQASVWLAK